MSTALVKADAGGAASRFRHGLRALALALPLPSRTKVRLYYSIFTDFFEIMSEGSGLLNYGQDALCERTAASLPRPGRWLDVGCGIGGPACLLAAARPDVEITGLNITPAQLVRARRKAEDAGLSGRVRFEDGDAARMPFPAAAFDGLYSIEAAFHFPDKTAFAREAHRVLVPRGHFACADMTLEDRKVSLGKQLFTWIFHQWLGVLHMNTLSRWRRDLAAAGFTEVSIEDLTPVTLGEGLTRANQQIDKHRSVLERRYPRFLIRLVQWGNRQVIEDLEGQPMRYVLITARSAAVSAKDASPALRGTRSAPC